VVKTQSILYASLKPLVQLGAHLFFRKLVLLNGNNLPTNRPVIVVANHQNAMLDPVMLCQILPKQLHWLTRADIFKNPLVNKLLRSVNMLPVYRERDKVEDLHAINNQTFSTCNDRLHEHAVISMFPEGTHRGKKQLIPLKKGVARMALNAMADGMNDLCIVPIGLDYGNYYKYRTTLLVNVGRPIEVKRLLGDITDTARAQNVLLAEIRAALKQVMIDIEPNDMYEYVYGVEFLCYKMADTNDLGKQFNYYHRFVSCMNTQAKHLDAFAVLAKPYLNLQHKLHLYEQDFEEKGLSLGKSVLLVLGAIPALLGAIVFAPFYIFAESVTKKIVKDPLFSNSIRLSIWTFLAPVYMLLLGAAICWSEQSVWMLLPTIFVVMVLGWLAVQWWPLGKKFMHAMRCRKYVATGNKEYTTWLQTRQQLISWINQQMK
jgi:1-acyl-sn-glycerol-3-phosphate acyltransferase